jgi:L-ascorbate metabolism protein UlaG (beta-lactamase superfamily)
MGPEDALRCVKFVNPKLVIPIHYDTWPLIAQDAQAFARTVQQEAAAQCLVAGVEERHTL